MAMLLKARGSAAVVPAAGSWHACARPLAAALTSSRASRSSSLMVVAFRESSRSASGVTKRKAENMQRATSKQPGSRGAKGTGLSQKQRTMLPPNAPRNKREDSESVVTFVGIAALFLTGMLFVVPALMGGSPATTKPLQAGINKTFGIEDRSADQSTRGKPYAEGPGPAAAPGTAATRQ